MHAKIILVLPAWCPGRRYPGAHGQAPGAQGADILECVDKLLTRAGRDPVPMVRVGIHDTGNEPLGTSDHSTIGF